MTKSTLPFFLIFFLSRVKIFVEEKKERLFFVLQTFAFLFVFSKTDVAGENFATF